MLHDSVLHYRYGAVHFCGSSVSRGGAIRHIDFDARVLGMKLGLGDIAPQAVCMGYQNACVCEGCLLRESAQRKRPARQPWTPVRRAA